MKLSYFLNNALSVNMAIDIGTNSTKIFIPQKGLVLDEPSYIACDIHSGEVCAVGAAAKLMYEKAPCTVKVITPIKNGVVANHEMAQKMIRHFIASVCDKTLLKPRVVVSVPADSTDIEKRAVCDILREAGSREIYLIEAPLAAAAGAGCDISLARGMLIAEIGGGRTNAASISLGASVIKKSIPVAGNSMDAEIIKYVRKNHNLVIGSLTAENIKNTIGCVYPFELSKSMTVSGCDSSGGMPRSVILNSEEIREVLTPQVNKIAQLIKEVLEDTPPELQADIMEDGILITGGTAHLYGIEKHLKNELGLKVFITEGTDECVVKGAAGELLKLDDATQKKFCYPIFEV